MCYGLHFLRLGKIHCSLPDCQLHAPPTSRFRNLNLSPPRFLELQPAFERGLHDANDPGIELSWSFPDESGELHWLDALDIEKRPRLGHIGSR